MPAPSWENPDEFLDTDAEGGFAILATVKMLNASTRQIRGIFDDPYLEASLHTFDADSNDPRFVCKETDTIGITRGCTLSVGGKIYDILTGPHADGTGWATLKLARQTL